MAQSVLSHAAEDLLEAALSRLRRKLSPRSVLLATFVVHTASTHLPRPEHPADEEKGWVYPACTSIERTRLARLVARQGLREVELGWPHVSQRWFALCLAGATSCEQVKEALPTLKAEPWAMEARLAKSVLPA